MDPQVAVLAQNEILLGERNYEQALDLVIGQAERELLIFDQDFSKGAYRSTGRHDLLRDFLARDRSNRLIVVLQEADYFVTHCPRLYGLLASFGHAMSIHEAGDEAKGARDCFVIADRKHYLRRIDIDHARFKYALADVETANRLYARFDELRQGVVGRITATRLGL
ncbi:MAG TPA: hypothetical protein VD885_00140 [Methylophilaceae bacterium]|nr:hypothetical protein [Methylophilaceae bacterium]